MRLDPIKQAVCDRAFAPFDTDPSIEVPKDGEINKIEGEVFASEDLYRVVRYQLDKGGPRYFEIRVKELQ